MGLYLLVHPVFLENLILNLLHEVEMEPNKRELSVPTFCIFESLTGYTKHYLSDICWNKCHVHHTV